MVRLFLFLLCFPICVSAQSGFERFIQSFPEHPLDTVQFAQPHFPHLYDHPYEQKLDDYAGTTAPIPPDLFFQFVLRPLAHFYAGYHSENIIDFQGYFSYELGILQSKPAWKIWKENPTRALLALDIKHPRGIFARETSGGKLVCVFWEAEGRMASSAILLYDSLGSLRGAVGLPMICGGPDGAGFCRIFPAKEDSFDIEARNIGCGGVGILPASCTCRFLKIHYHIRRTHPYLEADTTYLSFNGGFRDSGSGEVIYLNDMNEEVSVGYKDFVTHAKIAQAYSVSWDWIRPPVLSFNRQHHEVVIRFSNSPTTYTLTLSPDGKTLTSRGSDGSPVQTFRKVLE